MVLSNCHMILSNWLKARDCLMSHGLKIVVTCFKPFATWFNINVLWFKPIIIWFKPSVTWFKLIVTLFKTSVTWLKAIVTCNSDNLLSLV